MTPAELDRLDALCATAIMGWKLIQMHNAIDCWDDGTRNKIPVSCWHPTRLIDQAWEVLEKFTTIDKMIRQEGTSGKWICKIRPGQVATIHNFGYAEAETAPLAIVRACLVAKGVEI